MLNTNLNKAKKAKCDEFYTQYADIEKELQYYNIEGKTIYCNCDNPHYSNFYKYFKDKFNTHKIKYLYCTGYNKEGNGYYAEYNGTEETIKTLNGNGDFQSEESIEILNKSDVVITNPPFSLFRPYVKLLMDYNKKFLVIGNQNAITYKEIFPYIKNNELWLGVHSCKTMEFSMPMSYESGVIVGNRKIGKVPSISWFTNIDHINPNKPLILTKTYNPTDYPKYDNYDAINVNKVKDIPIDYDGIMGVPITFLQYYNPSQFEIIGMAAGNSAVNHFGDLAKYTKHKNDRGGCGVLNEGRVYARLLIKKNDSLEPVEFEILWIACGSTYVNAPKQILNELKFNPNIKCGGGLGITIVNGKPTYSRLLIKKR